MDKFVNYIPANCAKLERKVGIYARVSTSSNEQLKSLTTQISALTRMVSTVEQWRLIDIYIDVASAQEKSVRKDFNRMLEDCKSKQINIIITKSMSRFGRDTVETLEALRQLKELDVRVIFEQENLDTNETDSELMISIIESLAQAENESRSANIRWSIKQKAAQGTSKLYDRKCYGYDHDEDGKLIINEDESVVVQMIFSWYVDGKSIVGILKELEQRGIKSPTGKDKWPKRTVSELLSNEKYIGDALLQKTYTVDFLTKKRVKNTGIVPQYYVENSHEAIIPRDLYMQVQEEMVRRANLRSGETSKKRVYSSKYALSSIVCCSKCGDIYRRIQWNNRGKHSTVWRCCNRVEHGPDKCDAHTILESDLQSVVVGAINKTLGGRDTFLPALKANIEMVISENTNSAISEINTQLEELQRELLNRVNSKADYEDIADEIDTLREEKQNVLILQAEREGVKQRIEDMMVFLDEQPIKLESYNENLTRRLIQKITIYEDQYTVEFKSGVMVEVTM